MSDKESSSNVKKKVSALTGFMPSKINVLSVESTHGTVNTCTFSVNGVAFTTDFKTYSKADKSLDISERFV